MTENIIIINGSTQTLYERSRVSVQDMPVETPEESNVIPS